MEYLFIAIVAFVGAAAQSATGIGYAMICMALWPFAISFQTAAAVEVVTAFFMLVFITVRLRRHIRIKLLVWPLISSLVLSPLGVYALMAGSETVLRRVLGGVLVALALYSIFFSHRVRLKPTPATGLAAGALGGFLGGMLNIAGPPMALYFLEVAPSKEEYNATLQFYFCLTSVYIFMLHLLAGNVDGRMMAYGAAALAGLCGGMAVGLYIFRKLSLDILRRVIYLFIAAIGLYLVIRG